MSTVTFADRGHPTVYQPISSELYRQHYATTNLPIVIDNGTFECRAGWANAAEPTSRRHHTPSPTLTRIGRALTAVPRCCGAAAVRFRPFVGKTKYKKDPDHIRVGHQLREKDISRLKARTPFDGTLISYFETMELVLDYIFHSLGLSALSLVPHPVLMTEPLANPNYSRSHLSELLFECYAVPAATYAIDSLLAYHYLRSLQPDPSSTALIVSHGYESTTVIPIVDERPQLLQSTRLTPGCHAQHSLILNDLQLDYPEHKAHINEWRAQELCEDYATMLHDNSYDEQLRKVLLYDVDPRHKPLVEPVVIQLPFVVPPTVTETAEDLKAKEQKRQENIERLRAAAARKKEEMVEQLQADIANFEALKERRDVGEISQSEFYQTLRRGGFNNEDDFDATLTSFHKKLHRAVTGQDAPEEKKSDAELYPLLDIPDSDLTPEELKEKRRQRMFKAGADARQRKAAERDALLAQQQAIVEQEEEERRADPLAYIRRLRQRKADLIRHRSDRARRSEGGGRRTATSRKRMALLAQQMGRKERGEGGAGAGDGGGGEKEDDFGANDDDWLVYREAALPSKAMGGGGGGEADEESEEEKEELARLEEKLVLHDPQYLTPTAAPPRAVELDYQLTLYVDRIRAPELVWQPALVGLDEAGLTESVRRMLARMPADVGVKLCKEVWLVGGGGVGYKGYAERLERELRGVREVGSEVRVRRGHDQLDAWRGGQMLARKVWDESGEDDVVQGMCASAWGGPGGMEFVSRAEYFEMGGEYLKEHRWGNRFFPTPPPDPGVNHNAMGLSKKRKR